MPDTTHEEAKRCPRCQSPGELTNTHTGQKRGQKVEIYTCDNERCKWYQTSWIVTINADGTMPVRRKGEKDFPTETAAAMNATGRRYIEETMGELDSEDEEIRNPYSS